MVHGIRRDSSVDEGRGWRDTATRYALLPLRVFLLGSPVQASRLARRLGRNALYRLFTGDCGQLLGSDERMASVSAVSSSSVR